MSLVYTIEIESETMDRPRLVRLTIGIVILSSRDTELARQSKGSERLAIGRLVDDALRHRFHQSAKKKPDSAGGKRDQPETKARSKSFAVSRRDCDQWRSDVAVPDCSVGGAIAEPGDYRPGYTGISKYRGTTGLGREPGLDLLLRRYGFWPPLFEASRVAAGRSQGDDPAEGRMFRI